ncbi:Methylase of chemotaxis methyl-accepting protein [Hahella chejuensis KCTC 2396]|uniref:Methylase of chemotaxis methyl-accepting protein n=1 Tax=Hahella chejuensis (strain KCTC 2396) TaxID=349521 RepID=Q2SFJ6_HAHCH|nr:CheR family methyltransferase [Hahella chejuensis]ABC30578.1 Methylase of chemotaxis methyl-accepting protein [Hahella chejuensis KCTC 2396]
MRSLSTMNDVVANPSALSPDLLSACQWKINELWGLHYPQERWSDLERHLKLTSLDLGYDEPSAFARALLYDQIDTAQKVRLATELAVGETYFLRDPACYQHLIRHFLVPLLDQRRRSGRKTLRIWSAGCCSGEEAYSLAIMLEGLLPDMRGWNVELIATDLVAEFVEKAQSGNYGAWSFRQADPQWRARYFTQIGANQWAIHDRFRRRIHFFQLNLAQSVYPDEKRRLCDCDVILCRNVLMYFSPSQAAAVLDRLQRSLSPGGVLLLSPVESVICQWAGKKVHNWPEAVCLRRQGEESRWRETAPQPSGPDLQAANALSGRTEQHAWRATAEDISVAASVVSDSQERKTLSREQQASEADNDWRRGQEAYGEGDYDAAVRHLQRFTARTGLSLRQQADAAILIARSHANRNRIQDAEDWANQAIRLDRLQPAAYWLLTSLHIGRSERRQALEALARVIYLQPDFIMAHYLSGILCMRLGQPERALRCLRNCKELLASVAPEQPLEEGEGLTAGDLLELVRGAFDDIAGDIK